MKQGVISDVYFLRTEKIINNKYFHQRVIAEISLKSLPHNYEWGVFSGLEEVLHLLDKLPITLYAIPEGTLFTIDQPLLYIEGRYTDFLKFETSLLGLLCQASGIATKASRCRKAANDRSIISFGARRMHPAIAPMIERNAFIGGCDGVAVPKSADLIHEKPVGTMPHSLILLMGDVVKAALAFDEIIEPEVKRVILIDTFCDEKKEALQVAQTLGEKLFALRFDTPKSRRGNMRQILEEVRWELDLRGYQQVKLFVSGGIDEFQILELNSVVNAYGIGTSLSNAPVLDYSLDIVESEGTPISKRGKKSGKKQLLQCPCCYKRLVLPEKTLNQDSKPVCSCGAAFQSLLYKILDNGKMCTTSPSPQKIRNYVFNQLKRFSISKPS